MDVSHRVTLVKPGDVILLEAAKHTIPMIWKDIQCAITSEKDIVAIIEE